MGKDYDYICRMADGGIIDIDSDGWLADEGCSTCGYGRNYITEVTILLSQFKIYFEISSDDSFSVSDFMKLMCGKFYEIESMTEGEFFDWLQTQINDIRKYEKR